MCPMNESQEGQRQIRRDRDRSRGTETDQEGQRQGHTQTSNWFKQSNGKMGKVEDIKSQDIEKIDKKNIL